MLLQHGLDVKHDLCLMTDLDYLRVFEVLEHLSLTWGNEIKCSQSLAAFQFPNHLRCLTLLGKLPLPALESDEGQVLASR